MRKEYLAVALVLLSLGGIMAGTGELVGKFLLTHNSILTCTLLASRVRSSRHQRETSQSGTKGHLLGLFH